MFRKKVKSTAEACKHAVSPTELAAFFLERGWPTNESIRDAIEEFKFYSREPIKTKLILTELERSYGHKEIVNLEAAQIEHVMPQELTRSWREALGPEAEIIHERYLHTLGNLTLTGYNVELGTRPFTEKRATYLDSKITLNRYFENKTKWTGEEIVERTRELTKVLLDIWDRPDAPSRGKKPENRKR